MSNLYESIKDIALLHQNVNSFGSGDIFKLNDMKDIQYPMIWIELQTSDLNYTQINPTIRIYYVDRTLDDLSDSMQIELDSIQVLNDLIYSISNYYQILDKTTVTPFNQKFFDMCAGGYLDIQLSECADGIGITSNIEASTPNLLPSEYVEYSGKTLTEILNEGLGGTSDHYKLDNLGYDESGHIGFEREGTATEILSGHTETFNHSDIQLNTESRHTHSNKEILDTIGESTFDNLPTDDEKAALSSLKETDTAKFAGANLKSLQSVTNGGAISDVDYSWFKGVYSTLTDKLVSSWIGGLVNYVKALAGRVGLLEDSDILKYVVPVDSNIIELTTDKNGNNLNITSDFSIELLICGGGLAGNVGTIFLNEITADGTYYNSYHNSSPYNGINYRCGDIFHKVLVDVKFTDNIIAWVSQSGGINSDNTYTIQFHTGKSLINVPHISKFTIKESLGSKTILAGSIIKIKKK